MKSVKEGKRKDTGVELGRILGCLIVIGCHTYLPIRIHDNTDVSRALVAMFCADGVAVFWLILGFFLFKTQNYLKLCLRTISRIVIPMLLVSIFHFYFSAWLAGNAETITESVHRSLNDYKDAIKAFAMWTPIDKATGHLWYLYVYVLVILIFPALSGMVSYLDQSIKAKKAFSVLALLMFAGNLLTGNELMEFSHHTIRGLFPAAMIVVIGHNVYMHRDFLVRYGLYAPILFLALNLVRLKIYLAGFTTSIFWFTLIGTLCAICILAFSFSLVSHINNERFEKVIHVVASYTFTVYLIHGLTKSVIFRLLKKDMLKLLSPLPSFAVDIMFPAIMSIIIFITSLMVAVVIRGVKTSGGVCPRRMDKSEL